MKLTKLTLTACNPDKSPVSGVNPFSVMVNPETINTTQNLNYTKNWYYNGLVRFGGYDSELFAVPKIFLDATGAIPKCDWPINCNDIPEMIAALKKVVSDYISAEHEPPIVKIQWGQFLQYARLSSMNIEYKMFNRSGKPVRAEVSLKFNQYVTIRELLARQNKQSPDLTHLVEVKVGDTLPLMCARVYKDSSLYLQVAKANNLTNFRSLKPGSQLYFPPLVD
ncbi:MAG: hypothetical protein MJZ10_01465 [Fibrobacter sp.]|nr:hypothetical protein [Fibrobacter sp.]